MLGITRLQYTPLLEMGSTPALAPFPSLRLKRRRQLFQCLCIVIDGSLASVLTDSSASLERRLMAH